MNADRTTFVDLGAARWQQPGSMLSARRAFVLHLGATDGRRRRRFSGRVEHLSSGTSTHFSSLEGLLAFLTAFIEETDGSVSPDGGGRSRRSGSPGAS
jgi:hypothetical protein